jgi:D-inositol-3-phosphate glycosyltransferase
MEYQVQDVPEEWSLCTTRHDGIPVVAVTGEVDMSTAPALTAELIAQVEQHPAALVVHLGQVSFFGSSGVAALLDTHDRAKSLRVPLHLVEPGPNVVKTLQLTGMSELLSHHETLSDAIDAVRRVAREHKRIAIVSAQASPLTCSDFGQGMHVGQLSAALSALGHEVVVYTRRTDPAAPQLVHTDDGYDVAHVPAGPARPLAEDQVTPHLGEFAEFLAQRWRLRPPDVVHAHHWTSGLVAVIGAHSLQVPVVHSYNALGSRESVQRADAEALVARRASWIVATSSQEAAELRRRGVRRAQVSVVPCGVDVELFHPDGPVAGRGRRRRVVTAGELGEHSGVALVITALSTMEDTELVIAGEDDAGLRRLAGELGMLDRVVFAGAVPRAGMPALLRSADVVVCVPWFEPFGTLALQAMACGVPVVAAAVGALRDVVVHDVTGRHVPPRKPRVLARTLRQLLADDTRRQEFGAAARDRIMARHSRDRLGAELLAVYRRVDRAATGLDTAQGSA